MIAVVILAGGEGRRIGGDKPHRLLDGQSLLQRAVNQARGWSTVLAVSGKQGAAELVDQNLVHLDDRSSRGPIAGIEAALSFARARAVDRVLTIPCDTPFLPDDLRDRLDGGLAASAGAALASSGGRLHPTCGLWRASCLEALIDYLASGQASLHGFAESIGAIAVEWPVEPVDPFFNVNRTADLAEAERLLKNR